MADMPYVVSTVIMENKVTRQEPSRRYLTVKTVHRHAGVDHRLTFTIGLQQARSIHSALGKALAKADEDDRKDTP